MYKINRQIAAQQRLIAEFVYYFQLKVETQYLVTQSAKQINCHFCKSFFKLLSRGKIGKLLWFCQLLAEGRSKLTSWTVT